MLLPRHNGLVELLKTRQNYRVTWFCEIKPIFCCF